MDPVQNNQNQSNNTNPNIDTSSADGSALPFPVGGDQAQAVTPQTTTTTTASGGAPVAPPPADATGGNTPTVNETPPPPGNGSVVATVKPTRGKFGPTGLIATIFGVLLLVGATLAGVILVQQNQEIREKADGGDSCGYCAGADECRQNTGGEGNSSARAKAVCGGLNCCMDFVQGSSGSVPPPPGGCTNGRSCNGGECNDGFIFAPDSCAPQASCDQRAAEACAGHNGVKTGDITNPSPTPPSGNNSGAINTPEDQCPGPQPGLPGQNDPGGRCYSTTHPAFRTCPSYFGCAINTVGGCATLARELGCYGTGQQEDTCLATGQWVRFSCPRDFSDTGCNQNRTPVSGPDDFIENFCGSQQIDCTDSASGDPFFFGRVNSGAAACGTSVTPSPTPTDTPGCTGPNCSATLTASCLNIKAYNTDWVQLTAQELAALQPGTAVRFAVKGSATNGTFDKARFTINSVLRPEVTTTNPADTQQYYDEYVIPVGVTSFTIGAEVHHASLNTWN